MIGNNLRLKRLSRLGRFFATAFTTIRLDYLRQTSHPLSEILGWRAVDVSMSDETVSWHHRSASQTFSFWGAFSGQLSEALGGALSIRNIFFSFREGDMNSFAHGTATGNKTGHLAWFAKWVTNLHYTFVAKGIGSFPRNSLGWYNKTQTVC